MMEPSYTGSTGDARWKDTSGEFEGYDRDVVKRNSPVWSMFDFDEGNPLEPEEDKKLVADGGRTSTYNGGSPMCRSEDLEALEADENRNEPMTDGGYESNTMGEFHENYVDSSPAQNVFE